MQVRQELQFVKLNTYQTILQLARTHKEEGLCHMAEDFYKQAIAIARALDEPELTTLTESLYELASYYQFQGKDAEAEELWEEIKTYEQYSDVNGYIYVDTTFNLAKLKEKYGNPEQAEVLYKDILQKQEHIFGDESIEICPALEKLASFYCRQKKYPAAESLYLRILVIKEFHLGTCSVEINYTVDSLIDIFQKLAKWQLAEYMMNRQKAILLALHGEDSLCLASCAARLGELQLNTNRAKKAIENFFFALNVFKNKFGENSHTVISLQNKLNALLISNMEKSLTIPGNAIASDEISTLELLPPVFAVAPLNN